MNPTAARLRGEPRDERGSALLLDHCLRLERLTAAPGRPARERLEAALGVDLVRMLISALCGDHGSPGRLAFLS